MLTDASVAQQIAIAGTSWCCMYVLYTSSAHTAVATRPKESDETCRLRGTVRPLKPYILILILAVIDIDIDIAIAVEQHQPGLHQLVQGPELIDFCRPYN